MSVSIAVQSSEKDANDVTGSSDCQSLSRTLQQLFVSALNENNDDDWNTLLLYLESLSPHQISELATTPETEHYILRSLNQIIQTRLDSQNIVSRLTKLFPKLKTEVIMANRTLHTQRDNKSKPHHSHSSDKIRRHNRSFTYNGTSCKDLCSFDKNALPVTYQAHQLTSYDLLLSTNAVQRDALNLEISKRALLPTLPPRPHSSQGFYKEPKRKLLEPLFKSDFSPPTRQRRRGPVKTLEPNSRVKRLLQVKLGRQLEIDESGQLVLQTAEDVLHAIATNSLPSVVQDIYLNFTNSIPWNPYQLQVVPKTQRDPEHFVASMFGILHVYSDGECEHQSFAGWSRDKIIFNLIKEIPIFRDYLPRKMLKQWHNKVRQTQYRRMQAKVFSVGLRFHRPFSLALWKINSLSYDLLSIDVHTLNITGRYSQDGYTNQLHLSQHKLLKYLQKYFRFVLKIVCEVIQSSHSRVLELETEKQHKPFVSDLPISIQKKQHLQLEEELDECRHRRGQLDMLQVLVEQIVSSHLISLVEKGAKQWVELIINKRISTKEDEGKELEREQSMTTSSINGSSDLEDEVNKEELFVSCLLHTELELNEKGDITHSPSTCHLQKLLLDPLNTTIADVMTAYHTITNPPSTTSSQGSTSPSRFSPCLPHKFTPLPYNTGYGSDISLVTSALLEKLETNEVLTRATTTLMEVLVTVKREIDDFCEQYDWFGKLYTFLTTWEVTQKTGYVSHDMKPKDIERALMAGYTWLDKLSHLQPYFITSYSILCITTHTLVTSLRPRLLGIIDWVQCYCVQTVQNQCIRLTTLAKKHMEILSAKRYDLEGFASYSQQLRKIENERDKEKETIQFVLTLLNSLLVSGVLVSKTDRNNVEEMEIVWKMCGECVKEVSEFIEVQTPLKAQGLQENMEACEDELINLISQINQPPYNDPKANPSYILSQLDKVQEKVSSMQSRLSDLGKWRKAITGQSYDMTNVTQAVQCLYGRKELWRCEMTFNIVEAQWLSVAFKKLDIVDMGTKLKDWLKTVDKLMQTLPQDDPALRSLRDRIMEYNNLIPLLKQLSLKAIKNSHWHTLLSAVEVEYQPTHSYTLRDFILFKLLDPSNSDLVIEVCQGAEREATLKNSVEHLQQKWEQYMLNLQQKNSEPYAFAFQNVANCPLPGEKVTKFVFSSNSPQPGKGPTSHILIVTNIQEVLQDLENDVTWLQVLRGSAHALGNLKVQLEYWNTILKQLQEIVILLIECQEKWWNIVKLFDGQPLETQMDCGLQDLQDSSTSFQEITSTIHEDPFVLSLLERRRGQKGFRDLQGDSLRLALDRVLSSLALVLQKSQAILYKAAAGFPRLLTLSNSELLQALTHQGNPLHLLPILTKLFPALHNLTVIDVKGSADVQPGIPQEEGFQIVSIADSNSELLTLCVPLPVGRRRTLEWISVLERAIRYSLSCHLTSCLTAFPRQLLGNIGSEDDDVTVLTWLSDNVCQAVMLALECRWTGVLMSALDVNESQRKESLEIIRSNLDQVLDYSVHLLQTSLSSSSPQILNTLKNIIILTKHKIEMVDTLIAGTSLHQTTPLLTCILYHSNMESISTSQVHSRFGSIPQSLTNSRSSITQTMSPAAGKLHLVPEALVGSTKSLLNSRLSLTSQPHIAKSSISSIKSLLTSIPVTPTYCQVQCGDRWFNYGFEYTGTTDSVLVRSPVVERCMIQLGQSFVEYSGGLICNGEISKETGQEIAKVLGVPFYHISCIQSTTEDSIKMYLKAALQSGSILMFDGIDHLIPKLQILLAKWLKDIYEAMNSVGLIESIQPAHTSQKPSILSTPSVSSLTSHDVTAPRSITSHGSNTRIDWYTGQYGNNLLGKRVELCLWNESLMASSLFGCIGIYHKEDSKSMQQLKSSFRTVFVKSMDQRFIMESLLLSSGFTCAVDISKPLLSCLKELQETAILKISFCLLKLISERSCHYLQNDINDYIISSDVESMETQCVIKGLLDVCYTSEKDREALLQVLSYWFQSNVTETQTQPDEEILVIAVQRELEERHLRCKPEIIEKILQLHRALQSRRCVLFVGPSSSGKTTLFQTLSRAYNEINDKERVYVTTLSPETYTIEELFGGYSKGTNTLLWKPGILTRLLQQIAKSNDRRDVTEKMDMGSTSNLSVKYWILLDGGLSSNCVHWLESLIHEPYTIYLPNGETLTLPDNCRVLIESTTMTNIITPSLVTHCAVLYTHSLLTVEDVTVAWLERASIQHNLPTSGVEVLSSLMDAVVPPVLEYIALNGNTITKHIQKTTDINIHLVLSFLALLSAVLERNSPKQDDSSLRYTATSGSVIGSNISRMESIASLQSAMTPMHSSTVFERQPSSSRINATQSLADPSLLEMPASDVAVEDVDVLSECSDLEAQMLLTQQYQMTSMFFFALIWSFGGYVSLSNAVDFSDKLRELAADLPTGHNLLPTTGVVFDYFLDLKSYRFLAWTERKRTASSSSTSNNVYVHISELERLSYIIDLYLSYGCHILLVGEEGCGKTSFLNNYIQSRMATTSFPITSSLTPANLQTAIISRLSQLKKRQGSSKRSALQRNTFLLDNLHLASHHPYTQQQGDLPVSSNAIPIVQLVTYMAEYSMIPDLNRIYQHSINGIRLLGTATFNGVTKLTPSLLRHLMVVPFISVSNEGLCLIGQQKLLPWLQKFPLESLEIVETLSHAIAVASITLFNNMRNRFHSSPTHPHFLYSLHDISAMWTGLMLMTPNTDSIQVSFMSTVSRRGQVFADAGDRQKRIRTTSKHNSRRSSKGTIPTGRKGRQLGHGTRNLPSLTEVPKADKIKPTLGHQHSLLPLTGPGSHFPVKRQLTLPSGSFQLNAQEGSKGGEEEEERQKNITSSLRALFRLWCHENSRVFADRLTDSKDRIWFIKLLEMCLKYCYCGAEIQDNQSGIQGGNGREDGAGRRASRPGRPSRTISKQLSASLNEQQQTGTNIVIIQASDLKENGIESNIMRQLFPKDKQHQFLPYDQVVMRGEDLYRFMFARLPSTVTVSEGEEPITILSHYTEVGDGQLRDALSELLKNQTDPGLNHVIINRDSMEHVVRLCRALVVPGAHSLLLGPRGVGRKTAAKLAAALTQAAIYEVSDTCKLKGKSPRDVIKEACKRAGLDRKRVVLLVDAAHLIWHEPIWTTLVELMRDGMSPSLFTSSEMIVMSSKFQSGKLRRTAEPASKALIQAIHPNLHVVIIWDTPVINNTNDIFSPVGENLTYDDNNKLNKRALWKEEHWRCLFSALFSTTQYIDHYQPWSKNSYSEVALQYWQSLSHDISIYSIDSSELEVLSYLAAHIHLSAKKVTQQVLPDFKGCLATVKDYVQCLQFGVKMASDLKDKKKKTVERLHSALGKLYDLERKMSNLKWKLEDELQPTLRKAEEDVKHHMEQITAARQHYMEAMDKCKTAEGTINRVTKEVTDLKALVEQKFDEVSPSYYSALEALSSVERSVVMEIMGYRAPPEPLLPVFEALCLLFDRPTTWSDCQQLMLSQHFFESLRFFDKDNVPQSKLNKLEKLLNDERKISIQRITEVSQAVVPLVLWIAALVDYRKAKGTIQPHQDRLKQTEQTLLSAQEVYVNMRQEMLKTKSALEETVDYHKEALKKAKTAQTEVKAYQKKMDSINSLLNSLSNQKRTWEKQLSETQGHLDCLPSCSLLLAASCTYLGYLPPERHQELWQSWVGYCKGAVALGSLEMEDEGNYKVNIKLQEDFKCQHILANEEEIIGWEREEVFPDEWTMEKCLQWRTVFQFDGGCARVVFDPLNVFMKYFTALGKNESKNIEDNDAQLEYLSTDMIQSNIKDRLLQAAKTGKKVVLHVTSLSDTKTLQSVLYPLRTWTKPLNMTIKGKDLIPHQNFQFYLVLPYSLSAHHPDSHSFISFLLQVTPGLLMSSLECSEFGLSCVFLHHILQRMRKEICIQQRALLADLSLHKQQVTHSQDSVLSRVLDTEWTKEINELSEMLTKFIEQTEYQESSALQHIAETRKALDDITQHTTPYKSFAQHSAIVFLACQHLLVSLPQIKVNLQYMLDTLTSLTSQREGTRFHSSQTSLLAYLCHLENALTRTIHNELAPTIFSHQLPFFPLLVSLNKQLTEGEASKQKSLLLNPIVTSMESLLDDIVFHSDTQSIKEKTINRAQILENIPVFTELATSLQSNKEQWNEYVKSQPSLLLPTPLTSIKLTLTHKLLLWKALEPTKFIDAVQDFVNLTLGSEYNEPHLFQVPSTTPPYEPIVCLFYDQFTLDAFITTTNDRNIPLVVISAIREEELGRINELKVQPCWVVIEHLYLCEKWVETALMITKMLFSSQSSVHSDFHCYFLLSQSALNKLAHHMTSLSYHVITLPCHTHSSITILNEYHQILGNHNMKTISYSVNQLKKIVNKIHSLLPTLEADVYDSEDDHETEYDRLLLKVHSTLQSVQLYLHGKFQYTVEMGDILTCIVNNTVPEMWLGEEVNDDRQTETLIEFIQWVRQEHYY